MYAVYLNGITMAKIHKKRNEEKNKNIKKIHCVFGCNDKVR